MDFDFGDISVIEVPVKNLYGKNYVLREASEEAAAKWRNYHLRNSKLRDGKIVGLGDVMDGPALLLSMCMYEQSEKGEKLVNINVVRGWPARVVKDLFDAAKKISELEEKETRDVLEKRLQETRKKLDELNRPLGEAVEESPEKNGRGPTTAN